MKSYTSKALTENSLTTTTRTAGNAFYLVFLVFLLTTTSNSYAEITFTKIGDPVFEIVGQVTMSAPGSSSNLWNALNDVFGPSDLVVEGVGIVPIEPVDIPIDEHARREVAASGRVNTNVFAVEEIFWDHSWANLLSLSPSSTAAIGASPQSSNGPIR